MKKEKYKIKIRIPSDLHKKMLTDLKQDHPFAYERVGFLYTRTKWLNKNEALVIAIDYAPVEDEDYIKDKTVGARINSTSIRKAMQGSIDKKCGCFHVHLHDHYGKPSPSLTDKKGIPGVVQSLSHSASKEINGFLILSENGFHAELKINAETNLIKPQIISAIGYPMLFQFSDFQKVVNHLYDRQSFLGANSQMLFENIKIGIVGYGGGGSHIGQQLAHIGIKNIVVFDGDKIEDTNHNRLIGAWFKDIKNALFKTKIAERTIKKILPSAHVIVINNKWQLSPEFLQSCDIIVGCIDSYSERQQLEAECRRYLIPLIDIGMDVHKVENYQMSGQVILSMPGKACMSCYGFLTEAKLKKEAEKYGDVGGHPQVVWPNGILASTAVGILIDIITGWSGIKGRQVYMSFDGNVGTLYDHLRVKYAPHICEHYPCSDAGPALYNAL